MKRLHTLRLLLTAAVVFFASCAEPIVPEQPPAARPETRAFGDKTPKIMVYIETNDTNPLNAGDYLLPDGKPLLDMVEFFAANIHKRIVNGTEEPTLYFNPELTRLLEPDPLDPVNTGYRKYVQGLQKKGIKVLITIIGDHQQIGLATMNPKQTTQFARIWPML